MTNSTSQKKSPGRVTSAQQWKAASKAGAPLRVPSGNTALVRAPGMQLFLEKGFIPNSLMPIVVEALNTGKPPQVGKDLVSDPKKLTDMMDMVDRIVVYCVLEPKVTSCRDQEGNLIPESERDEELLYADEVDLEDKMFIFQYAVGGTKDVESFRTQLAGTMEVVQSREDVGSTTESTDGDS